MSKYKCIDCNETSDLPFKGGVCSKCGSLNIRNTERKRRRKGQGGKDEDFKKSILMILLWGFIIYTIYSMQ
jgi:hypothetical protein